MTASKGRPTGQGYNFGGERARTIKARMAALRIEQQKTGRIAIFDTPKAEEIDK